MAKDQCVNRVDDECKDDMKHARWCLATFIYIIISSILASPKETQSWIIPVYDTR